MGGDWPKSVPLSKISLEEFQCKDFDYSAPVIVTGLVEKWKASEWTYDDVSSLFGHKILLCSAPQFSTKLSNGKLAPVVASAVMKYSLYMDYLKGDDFALSDAQWIEGNEAELKKSGLTLYCGSVSMATDEKSEIVKKYFGPGLLPENIENLNGKIPLFYEMFNHHWLYVSTKGALTPLHFDNNFVHATLAQIKGEKEASLICFEELQELCFSSEYGYIDIENPDIGKFPRYKEATRYYGKLVPGDMMIMPSGWGHFVRTLSDSITVSFDFINSQNLKKFARGYHVPDMWFNSVKKSSPISALKSFVSMVELDKELALDVWKRMEACFPPEYNARRFGQVDPDKCSTPLEETKMQFSCTCGSTVLGYFADPSLCADLSGSVFVNIFGEHRRFVIFKGNLSSPAFEMCSFLSLRGAELLRCKACFSFIGFQIVGYGAAFPYGELSDEQCISVDVEDSVLNFFGGFGVDALNIKGLRSSNKK